MVLGRQIEIFKANLINLQTAGVYINTSSFRPLQEITMPSTITIITTIITNRFNNYGELVQTKRKSEEELGRY